MSLSFKLTDSSSKRKEDKKLFRNIFYTKCVVIYVSKILMFIIKNHLNISTRW